MISIILNVSTAAEAIAAFREIQAAGIGATVTTGTGERFRMTGDQTKHALTLGEKDSPEYNAYREKCRIEKMGVAAPVGNVMPEGEEY